MNTTELTLNQIIATSGDSTLLSYKYENQVLEFTLHHSGLDKNILFKVETSELRVLLHDNYIGDTTSKTCFIELLELSTVLQVANHHYIPSTDFGKLMQECKLGLNLVYGKKVEDNKYFLSLKGTHTLLCCVLHNLSKFTFVVGG
jgi:hypothetical protein